MDERMDDFTDLIMEDIISSFDLDINQNKRSGRFLEVRLEDLHAGHMVYGGKLDDSYYNSLEKHFMGAFRGEPRLFVTAKEAYLLYKKQDNTNVMIHLKLKGNEWKEVDRKKKKGNEVKLPLLKCYEKYLKEKHKNSR
ncbi:hypothetical protein [Bacillus sp. BHET2]|uniref:hypothetical protein n=1 Tax=Bacillus sp. BHET2 TaxID=2583818 RepID=UPI001F0F9930|nr:hypothetical protein [Bacillus sp. BHET2]